MLFRSLRFKNLLSFADTTIELQPLNILIGANASGKSNLIEAIGLLKSLPSGLEKGVRPGGGITEWQRKTGETGAMESLIEAHLNLPRPNKSADYSLQFAEIDAHLTVLTESFSATLFAGRPKTSVTREGNTVSVGQNGKSSVSDTASVFEIYKNPADPTGLTPAGRLLDDIQVYKSFDTGPGSNCRRGTSTSASKNRLEDGGNNLALVLHEMQFEGTLTRLRDYLRRYGPRFTDLRTQIEGSFLRLWLEERPSEKSSPILISSLRLSDGTLKMLCLLAVLCRKNLPPLICIEEPEIGLHPDAMSIVADLLIEAAERTQLIVTTHSDALLDYFSSRPESVLVCERDFDDSTQFVRLEEKKLASWLKEYRLGHIWRSGEIGANAW